MYLECPCLAMAVKVGINDGKCREMSWFILRK